MPPLADTFARLAGFLREVHLSAPKVAVLSGAGISAESGIPTFRGPEGYWRVGAREYRPQEMATLAMFRQKPWEVWSWYLYRRWVCSLAQPNPGHLGVARLEHSLGSRFRLITQNVDGLHLQAGNSLERTFQIHGNLHFMRCARSCSPGVFPMPLPPQPREKNQPVTGPERERLVCPDCGGLSRPHVLWFDECYDECFYRFESTLRWAEETGLLLVVGTSGATSLPQQTAAIVFGNPEAVVVDINPEPNPFRALVQRHPRGVALEGESGILIPRLMDLWDSILAGNIP